MTALPRPQGERLLFNIYNGGTVLLKQPAVGQLYTDSYGHSQFSGRWAYKISRIDHESGDVFGVYESGDVYELDIEDCI